MNQMFWRFFLKLKIPKFPYLDDHVHDQSQPLHLKHLEVPKVGVNGAQKAQMTAKSFWFQRFLFFFIPHCQLINNHVFWANFSTRWFHEIINFVLFFQSLHWAVRAATNMRSCSQKLSTLVRTYDRPDHWDDTTAGADFIKTTDRTLGRAQINNIRLLNSSNVADVKIFCISRSYALLILFDNDIFWMPT